jgi:hypothetical protein
MGWFSRKRIRTSGTKNDEAALAQFRVDNKKIYITSISQGFPLYKSIPYDTELWQDSLTCNCFGPGIF